MPYENLYCKGAQRNVERRVSRRLFPDARRYASHGPKTKSRHYPGQPTYNMATGSRACHMS